ncbi:alkaline phosphatase family protein [Dokdonella sp.]|uniref:alkaline phosphatase family protein n=1 Tax=Dokdonella sp. TaxID=2291710 RepID=UPI0035287E19
MRIPGRALACLALLAIGACNTSTAPESPAKARTIVVGFDGFDPVLAERWMDEGRLPNFSALRAEGHYQPLATSNPPQSPVAWASFATGEEPGEHGIFDFLRRAPGSYSIDFSIAEQSPPSHVLPFFGWRIPLDEGELRNRRKGTPFWMEAEQAGQRATVLRVPVTYPADPISHMISGMGVPDLLGTQGTYTLLATRRIEGAENGGRIVLAPVGEDGVVRTRLEGPAHPLKPDAPALSVPLLLEAGDGGATLTLDGSSHALKLGEWSPWIRVRFNLGILGSIPGMFRAHLMEGFPRPLLYISPLQADPTDSALPISAPAEYSAQLAARIGLYHTLGMPEETWALDQGHLDESAWLDVVRTTLAEGEAMLYDALDRHDSELVIEVFVQTDRVSHMFWRGLDPGHPGFAQSSETARNAVPWIYAEADRVLGEVRQRMDSTDRLIVLSDHGFSSYRRSVHLNRWLVDHGYMVLKPDVDAALPLFAAVDWSKTRAYALGLNGIYLNRKGREPEGIVEDAAVAALKQALSTALAELRDPADQARIVRTIYDASTLYHGENTGDAPDLVVGYEPGYRASWQTSLGSTPPLLVEDNLQKWSGDHCIDPSAVPGVLFTSFAPAKPVTGIADLARLIRESGTPAATGTAP